MRIIYILAGCLLITGCRLLTDDNTGTFDSSRLFSNKKDIVLNGEILIKSNQLIDPWTIVILDSLLIIGNEKADPALDIYDLKGRMLRQILKRGKDLLSIRFVGSIQADDANGIFYVFDLYSKKILKFDVKGIFEKREYLPSIFADFLYFQPNKETGKFLIKDNSFIAESLTHDGRVLKFENKGEKLKYYGKFPEKSDTSLTDDEYARLFSYCMAMSPDKSKLATASYNAGILNLYSLDRNSIDSVWSHVLFLPTMIDKFMIGEREMIAFNGRAFTGYIDVAASQDCVFALFSGKQMQEKYSVFSDIIHVVSWDGKRRYRLKLDRKIKRLAVSKNGDMIYAISINNQDEPEIVKYSMNSIKL